MKGYLLAAVVFYVTLASSFAQEARPKTTQIYKGQTFFSGNFQAGRKKLTDNSFYQTPGLALGGGYYVSNRFALKAAVTGQQYQAQPMLVPTNPEFDQRRLIFVSGQLRYNFWEMPGLVSTFLETGYSYGRFTGAGKIIVTRWEILSAGETFSLKKAGLPQLGFEVKAGLERDNLTRKLSVPLFMGFNYYFGKAAAVGS